MAYDNTNSGALFSSVKKSEKSPDFTGKINVEGKEYRLAGWRKTSQAGKKYLSLKVSTDEYNAGRARAEDDPAPHGAFGGGANDPDDSIPFAPEWR